MRTLAHRGSTLQRIPCQQGVSLGIVLSDGCFRSLHSFFIRLTRAISDTSFFGRSIRSLGFFLVLGFGAGAGVSIAPVLPLEYFSAGGELVSRELVRLRFSPCRVSEALDPLLLRSSA